jgi:nuclear cap-binding protein subunit 1
VAPHHKELSSEERLVSFIERVGEDTTQSSLESNLEKLAELICQELVEFKDKILQVITKCAREYSGKVSIYTTLVGILNARKVDIGNELVDLLFEDLKSALISNDFTTVRTLVRFLSDLMNAKVVPPSSIIALFDTFITVTYEPGISQLRSDWYMNLILSALPWVGAELQSKRQMDLERLMTAIEGYMSKRITNYLPAIQVWQTERPYPQRDQLELLWSQIFKMKENNWKETILLRPYTSLGNEISAYTHPLPNIVVPGHTIDSTYPLPTVVFRCIGDTDLPAHFGLSFPSIDSIDYYLIQDIIRSIINSHSSDRKNCAHQLNLLIEKYSNIPVEYMLAEVVFGMMLQLPSPTHCLLYYGSLNIELCKLRPATYPLILSQFIDILFAQLDHMNSIAVNRFAWWFSYHLSNYQYLWEWTKWVWCVQCPPDNVSHRFVKLVFQCCSRLASYETFSEIIPEVFHPLLPALPTSDFLYEKDIEGSQLAGKLIESIRAKIPLDELLAVLNEDMGIDDDQHLLDVKISVLTHCVLHIGDKTISHCFIALHKFRSLFLALLETDHAKIKCLCSVAEFFTLNPQLHCLVIDKLVRQELIDNSTVINWLFGHADHIDLTR